MIIKSFSLMIECLVNSGELIQAKALTVKLQVYFERSRNLVPSILCKHQCHWTIISQEDERLIYLFLGGGISTSPGPTARPPDLRESGKASRTIVV
jgi:hypothetical protein